MKLSEAKFICVGNDYYKDSFEKLCKELEAGELIHVGVDCIGHTRNNYTQEAYREKLEEKYGEFLEVHHSSGVCSYSYYYKLK